MARFQPAIDIWTLSDEERARLPIGQWVYAGERANLGRFYGQGSSTVVAWLGNARNNNYREYMTALRNYGANVRKR